MTNHQFEPTYALLWSGSQRCFHVEPLRTMLEKNRKSYVEGRASDFIPVFVGGDDECRLVSRLLRRTLAERGRKAPQAEDSEPARVGGRLDAFLVNLVGSLRAPRTDAATTPQ